MGYLRGAVLGNIDDPFADDFDVVVDDVETFGADASEPGRAAYVTWAAAVKRYGGVVATAPSSTGQIAAGVAAARYPVAVVSLAPSGELNPIFHRWPDLWTGNGAYAWYRAPDSVLVYTNPKPFSLWDVGTWFGSSAPTITTPQTVPGEPPPGSPHWYDDIKDVVKIGGLIVAGLVVLNVLSYLPRRRD